MKKKDLDYFKTRIVRNYLNVIDKKTRAFKSSDGLKTGIYSGHDNLNNILQAASKGEKNYRPEEKLYFINREEEYMKHLIAALERIDKNKYGLCVRCGKEIPKERLEEVPHTRYCVPCKNNVE